MEIHFVKNRKQLGTRKITHVKSFLIHILFLVRIVSVTNKTDMVWTCSSRGEKRNGYNILFRKIEGGKKAIKNWMHISI